ncbi:MAG: hypothetical protein ACR2O6_02250 [Ilumatobacteraceae bacterium]
MSTDPVQLLDRLSPPEGWSERTDLDADPVAAEILARVFATEDTPVVSLDAERKRRRRSIGVVVVVAAVVTGGAVAALLNSSPEETRRIACWSEAGSPPEQIVALSLDGQIDPVALCEEQWSSGIFEAEPPDELAACVTDVETAAVIPGGAEVCTALGFTEMDTTTTGDGPPAINAAQRELARRFSPPTCETRPEIVRQETNEVLDEFGLSGWTITFAGTSSADEPCAIVALAPEVTTAIVTFRPRDI